MPTREDTYRAFVDSIVTGYVPYISNRTPVNDVYMPYISGTPVSDADDGTTAVPWVEEPQWDEEWSSEGYVDVSGEVYMGMLVGENYVEISPQFVRGFAVRSPHKRVVFCFYDEDRAEIWKSVIYRAAESIIIPPENARYMRAIVEEYGDACTSNVLIMPLQEEDISTISEESIKNFKSFIGGQI